MRNAFAWRSRRRGFAETTQIRRHSAWSLVVPCAAVLAFLGFFGHAISASDPASNEAQSYPMVPLSAILRPASGNAQGMQSEAGSSMWATAMSPEVLTHTVFLPLFYKGYYWRPPDSLLGIQTYVDHREDELVLQLDQAGVRWARIPLWWAQFEPRNTTPENYRWWPQFEDWLARLSARNIKVILTLDGNPGWAARYTGGRIDKVPIAELAQFMQAAVARYSRPPYNIKHWELYNEPDNGSAIYAELGWGYWGKWPGDYANMLKAVYAPMKAADPRAQIVMGGLAYDNFEPAGPFVRGFLDKVLEEYGGAHFDVMNFHYYPVFDATWDPWGPGIIGKATFLRSKLADYGVYKPLICTEAGMWSDAEHGGSFELQSRFVPRLYARSMEAELLATIWYKLVDDEDLGTVKYGLLEYDLTQKPAFTAYQTVARQLAPADYVRPLAPAETGSSKIEAYEFRAPASLAQTIAAWTNDDLNHTMSMAAANVMVVDKYGAQTQVYDGDDGVVDGQVQVRLGPSPVYLHPTGGTPD